MKYYNKLLSSLRRAVPVEETWRNLLLQPRPLCLACAPAFVGFAPGRHPHIDCHRFHLKTFLIFQLVPIIFLFYFIQLVSTFIHDHP